MRELILLRSEYFRKDHERDQDNTNRIINMEPRTIAEEYASLIEFVSARIETEKETRSDKSQPIAGSHIVWCAVADWIYHALTWHEFEPIQKDSPRLYSSYPNI